MAEACSTAEARPEKPGNSAEEEATRTRKGEQRRRHGGEEPAIYDGRHTSGNRAVEPAAPSQAGAAGGNVTADDGKTRKAGIPVVMDRIVTQSTHVVFQEIFDPGFTESAYGFRSGKSQRQVMRHVQELVKSGYRWCTSVDLKSYFDEVPLDLILRLIRRAIADEQVVTLVAGALKAGVMVDGRFEKTFKGAPQGSPLSPMLKPSCSISWTTNWSAEDCTMRDGPTTW